MLTLTNVKKGFALSFNIKLPRTRSLTEFVVYPPKAGEETILIQSDTRIGVVNLSNGVGLITPSLSVHPSFHMFALCRARGTLQPVTLDLEPLQPFLSAYNKGFATTADL